MSDGEAEGGKKERDEMPKLHWKDYVALLIAAFEAYSLPFVMVIAVIIAVVVFSRLL